MAIRRLGGAVLLGNRGAARLFGPLLYESFTGADGAIAGHAADTGQPWGGAGSSISGNTLLPGGNFTSISTVDVGAADYTVQCTASAVDATKFPQVNLRVIDANNYLLLQQQSSTQYYFGKRVAGAFTQLALVTVTPTVGDVFKIQVSGSNATVWINGTQQFTGAVGPGVSTTSTLIGFNQGTAGVGRFDDLTVTA